MNGVLIRVVSHDLRQAVVSLGVWESRKTFDRGAVKFLFNDSTVHLNWIVLQGRISWAANWELANELQVISANLHWVEGHNDDFWKTERMPECTKNLVTDFPEFAGLEWLTGHKRSQAEKTPSNCGSRQTRHSKTWHSSLVLLVHLSDILLVDNDMSDEAGYSMR